MAGGYELFKPTSPFTDILYRAANDQDYFGVEPGALKRAEENCESDSFNRHTADLNSYTVINEFKQQFPGVEEKKNPQLSVYRLDVLP